MKKILILLILFGGLITQAQVNSKLELSFEYADFYKDTLLVGTIKTHTNFDFYSEGHFLSWSSGSDRPYHFIYPISTIYEPNRITFTRTDISYVYKCNFIMFEDSIGLEIQGGNLKIFNKNYHSIIFYNKINK